MLCHVGAWTPWMATIGLSEIFAGAFRPLPNSPIGTAKSRSEPQLQRGQQFSETWPCTSKGLFRAYVPRCPMYAPRATRAPSCAHPKGDLKTLCAVLGAVAIGGTLENDDALTSKGPFPDGFWTSSPTVRWPRTRLCRPIATSLTSRWQAFDRFVEYPVQIRWRTPTQWSHACVGLADIPVCLVTHEGNEPAGTHGVRTSTRPAIPTKAWQGRTGFLFP